ncbi:hypothetical protein GALMADRAFT_145969 [Galerina marginata CBS 339.88]|uniref:Uncharacterized protein n=1 Tax=Galerina marginata (strain CBS 339.88) TaxID=685588 RepID=A0A067SG53_GALM3|nr:hypothetical protein GALMADRAFT_145969 [Galerina marginata CBS 339.88]
MPNCTLHDFWKLSRRAKRGDIRKATQGGRIHSNSSTGETHRGSEEIHIPTAPPGPCTQSRDNHGRRTKRQKSCVASFQNLFLSQSKECHRKMVQFIFQLLDQASSWRTCNASLMIPPSAQKLWRLQKYFVIPTGPSNGDGSNSKSVVMRQLGAPSESRKPVQLTSLPFDIMLMLLGCIAAEGGARTSLISLSQTCNTLRLQCCHLYLCEVGVITPGSDFTTLKLLDDIPPIAIAILMGLTALQDGRNFCLELDPFHLVELNHQICSFISQCAISSFCLQFCATDQYLLGDSRISSALISVIGSLGSCCVSITFQKIFGYSDRACSPFRLPLVGISNHGDPHAVILPFMDNLLVCKLDTGFFCTPSLRLILPLFLQGGSVFDLFINCPTTNAYNHTLSLIRFPRLETFSATVYDLAPIFLPDCFSLRHRFLENLTLINSVGRTCSLWSDADIGRVLQLPRLKTARISANYNECTMQDASVLTCLHIQPVAYTAPPHSAAFCGAVRSLRMTLSSIGILQFSNDFKLIIDFPLRLTRHIWLSGHNGTFDCSCVPGGGDGVPRAIHNVKTLELSIDSFDDDFYVS